MAAQPPQARGTAPAKEDTKPDTGRKDLGPGSLAGNLTRDPKLRYTPTGRAVASLRVAVSERKLNKHTGEWEDGPTEFFDVAAWGNLGEHVVECLEKGNRVVAEGHWESQSWEGKEGEVQERVVLVARDLGPSLLFAEARVSRPRQGGR